MNGWFRQQLVLYEILAEPAEVCDWYSPIGEQGYTDFPPHSD